MAVIYKVLGSAVVGSTRTFNTISNKALTSNVATLTTGSTHSFAVGDVVTVSGVDSVFDGTYVVATVPTGTTFTYMRTNANVTSAAVSPVGVVSRGWNLGGVASANKYSTGTFALITTGTAHGFAVNDWVYVTLGDANLDGSYRINGVPSTTTFTYAKTATAVASTAVTTGAVARLNASAYTTLYTVPASTAAVVSTITVANLTQTAAQYRIATPLNTTTVGNADLISLDGTVAASDTITLSLGIALEATRKIMVAANSPEITFIAYGTEIA